MLEALGLVVVTGALWGCTNPLIRAGARGLCQVRARTRLGQAWAELVFLLCNWRYVVPFALNQLGSLSFLWALRRLPLSLAVPAANGLAFACTACVGAALGKEEPLDRGSILGIVLVALGITLCCWDSRYIYIRGYHGTGRVGNREVVGHGVNGSCCYKDDAHFPFPAVRFRENSPNIVALRKKEQGDWKALSLAEKKTLYRASFCQTFAEFQHPTGQWKFILGGVFILSSFAFWIMIFYHQCVQTPLPMSLSPGWQRAQLRRMLDLHVNDIDGLASLWDYDNDCWKSESKQTKPAAPAPVDTEEEKSPEPPMIPCDECNCGAVNCPCSQ